MTQTERVIKFIREHPGCTTLDLLRGMDPPITNPRARISDIRKLPGFDVECKSVDGVARYRLIEAFDGTLQLDRAS